MLALYLLVFGLAASPGAALAPRDTVEQDSVRRAPRAYATLEGWDRRARTAVWDRTHAIGGRYQDRGPLRRWSRQMDHEYDLDLYVIRPTPADDAAFYASDGGARSSAGSVTTGHFAIETEIRAAPRVGGPFLLEARLVQQEDYSARRAAVELGYFADLGHGHAVGVRHSFAEFKSDLDAELVWQGERQTWRAEASVGLLDAVNDLINEGLVPDPVHDDTLRVYRGRPLWLAGRGSVLLGPARLEAVGGLAPRRVADVRRQSEPDDRFSLAEAWAHGGLLVESAVVRAPGRSLAVGAMVRGTRASASRDGGAPAAARYDARQTTWEAGAYALGRWRAARGELWLARERVADRQAGDAFGGSVIDGPFDVAERWTWARARLDWAPGTRSGPTLGAELAAGLRSFPDPDDQDELTRSGLLRFYPYGPNWRASLRAGWRLSPRADFVFGASRDLDGDPFYSDAAERGRYDGAYVRLRATW